MTYVFSHRGLDPSIRDFPLESSFEAFASHLDRDFGIEFDLAFLRDGRIGVIHDTNLGRISGGLDRREVSQLSSKEFQEIRIRDCRFVVLDELLELFAQSRPTQHALHLKGRDQTEEKITTLLGTLKGYPPACQKITIFDLLPFSAQIIKQADCGVSLACSLAKPYDIARYNTAVSGTLLSIDQFLQHRELFDSVWLDEWDLCSISGGQERFYTAQTFDAVRASGAKISLVTPELHASSPGLLGGESHQDAKDFDTLERRIFEILKLGPDAVCTDYPDRVRELAAKI